MRVNTSLPALGQAVGTAVAAAAVTAGQPRPARLIAGTAMFGMAGQIDAAIIAQGSPGRAVAQALAMETRFR